jgi:hypothetical protein
MIEATSVAPSLQSANKFEIDLSSVMPQALGTQKQVCTLGVKCRVFRRNNIAGKPYFRNPRMTFLYILQAIMAFLTRI